MYNKIIVALYSRIKLHCLQDKSPDEEVANKSCDLLYIDQLIEHEFGGERVRRLVYKLLTVYEL